jgi:Cu+-exporting ATPase
VIIQVPEDFKALPGRGITCKVSDRDIAVGNRRLMEEENVTLPAVVEEQVQKLECEAKT